MPKKNDPVFYTYNDEREKPIVTVCLAKKGKQFARGLSIRSRRDYHRENVGNEKAKGRATKAITRKKSDLPVNRDEAIRLLFEAEAPPFRYKAEFPAALTPNEEILLEEAGL